MRSCQNLRGLQGLGLQTPAFGYEEFGFESQDQRRSDGEMRVICHGILESQDQKKVQIVAHITSGCDSGYVCMMFHKRDTKMIEIQQTSEFEENPDEACKKFDPSTTPFSTLVTYSCHGSWNETGVKSSMGEPMRYCFIYTLGQDESTLGSILNGGGGESHVIVGNKQAVTSRTVLNLTRVTDSCHRIVTPGSGNWAYNFTNTGACKAADLSNSGRRSAIPSMAVLMSQIILTLTSR